MSEVSSKSYFKPIELNQIIKRTGYVKGQTEEIADKVMDGEFVFFQTLETFRFDGDIDWDYKHNSSSSTYELYMHSLDIISYLCNHFEQHKKN